MLILSWNVQENSRHIAEVFGGSLEQYSVNFLQNIKNGASNYYFVKIKTFRLQTGKFLRNRRKAYILDVICDRFYFGEVQQDVLGQCNAQGISVPKTEGLIAFQWYVEKNMIIAWQSNLEGCSGID